MVRNLLYLLLMLLPCTVLSEYRKLIPKCANSCLTSGSVLPTNCFCDSKCSLMYNDCCLDAPYRTIRVTTQRAHNMHCAFLQGENSHFWMVDTCPGSWDGYDYIRDKCIADNNDNDITGGVPVTSPADGITYRNYYCALCNAGQMDNLVEWRVKTLCTNIQVTQEDVLQNLTFVEDKQHWGVWKVNDSNDTNFHECYLLYQRPFNVTDGIRKCVGGMVSTCPRSWKNIATRRKCKSYVDPVKWKDGPVYRNLDCAVCHNVTLEGSQCFYDVTSSISAIMLERAMRVDTSSTGQWL